MKHTFLILLFFICAFNCCANLDSLQAFENQERSLSFLKEMKIDSAEYYEIQVTKYFYDTDNLYAWLKFYREKGRIFDHQENYNQGIETFKKAIEQGWRTPKNKDEFVILAWVNAALGQIHLKLNNQRAVVNAYENALSIFIDSLNIENCSQVGKYIYGVLGNSYNRLRDYEKATFFLSKRKQICTKDEDSPTVAKACLDLGALYFNLEEYPKAIKILLEGLELDAPFGTKIDLLSTLADAYFSHGELDKMLFYNKKSYTLIRQSDFTEEEKNEYLVWVNINFGKYYREINDYHQAEKYLFQAEILLVKDQKKNQRLLSIVYTYQGILNTIWRRPKTAQKTFHAALIHLLPSFNDSNVNSLPTENQLVDDPNLLGILANLARVYIDFYHQNSSQFAKEKALQCFELAARVESNLLQRYTLTGSQLTGLKEYFWLKQRNISFLYKLWQQNPTKDLEEKMFGLSERSRAFMVLENLDIANAINTTQTKELQTQYNHLNDRIDSLQNAIYDLEKNQKQDWKTKTNTLQSILFNTKVEKTNIVKQVDELLPELNLEREHAYITIKEVQRNINEETALVEYFLGEESVFIFIITAENVSIKKMPWNEEWSQKTRTINVHIFNQTNEKYIQQAHELFEYLVQPILEVTAAKKLMLIPHGELWNIPFDALLTQKVGKTEVQNFKNLPYLLNEKSISYPFSATLLFQIKKSKKKFLGKKLFAYAPAYRKIKRKAPSLFALRNNLDTLFYNQSEATEIATHTFGESIVSSMATKKYFFKKLNGAKFLHIAAHAKSNLKEPNFSYIAFSNTGDTLTHPYKLFAHELYNQSIQAEMVVLSACETGTGPIAKGEGIISLSRAFAYGGAESIITTLWSIPASETTKNIMIDFYKNLKNGKPKDFSLREAKLNHISKNDHIRAHPKYWAAFIPLGNMEVVSFDSFSWKPYFLISLVGLIFFVIVLLWRKRLF